MQAMKKVITILFLSTLILRALGQPPIPSFSILSTNVKVCNQADISFKNTTDTTGNSLLFTYVWDFGDSSHFDTIAYTKPVIHHYSSDGKYSITLTIVDTTNKKKGNILASKVRKDAIRIYSPYFKSFSDTANDFETFNYTFRIPEGFKPFDPNVWHYEWNFGDNVDTITDSVAIFHHYKAENLSPGYKVKLTISLNTDKIELSDKKTDQCFFSDSLNVLVYDGFFKKDSLKREPLIPNIFTPNKDGVNDDIVLSLKDTNTVNVINNNDIFLFKTNGEQIFTLWVYNRWGQLVYKTENKTIVWNGKSSSGDDLDSGVYYYVVQSDAPDKRHKTAGMIQIFRE